MRRKVEFLYSAILQDVYVHTYIPADIHLSCCTAKALAVTSFVVD